MSLSRRAPEARSPDEIGSWAQAHKANVETKYGNPSSKAKRSSGQNLFVFLLLSSFTVLLMTHCAGLSIKKQTLGQWPQGLFRRSF